MWVYELPTTASVSFSEFVVGGEPSKIASTTSTRATLKTLLKESKRSDGERDYLNIIKAIDEYLPWLYALIGGVKSGALTLSTEPVFSWRSILGSHILASSPRVPVPSLHGELAFTLLTYGLTLSNLAHASVVPLGSYEHERATSTAQRTAHDTTLGNAVQLLCRAAGVFSHLAEVVVPQWDASNPGSTKGRPVDLSSDVLNALSALSMAEVHVLAIRRMFSKASAESALTPGPPLPASHPTPAIVAKLHLHVQSTLQTSASFLKSADASADLRRYAERGAALQAAIAHKWLGVEAGEAKRAVRCGEAIAWLRWARDELDGLKKANVGELVSRVGEGREREAGRGSAKALLAREIESATAFLKSYTQLNDTVHFDTVPQLSALKGMMPTGRSAMTAKEFTPPAPAYTAVAPSTTVGGDAPTPPSENNPPDDQQSSQRPGNYALAGSYF